MTFVKMYLTVRRTTEQSMKQHVMHKCIAHEWNYHIKGVLKKSELSIFFKFELVHEPSTVKHLT